ncbi:hypothetical protein [Flexithrix dorotheae]|uniref:hypothetical protein n=1 Tax=Flexithrix dorotheae TaxID=70993 RepID=UPI000363A0B0|nr:hypothetical protein [Flexithrix dorotheae]
MVILYYVICIVALSIVIKFICYLLETEDGEHGSEWGYFPSDSPIPDLPKGITWPSEEPNDAVQSAYVQDFGGREKKGSLCV